MRELITFPKMTDDKPLKLMSSKQVKEYLGISRSTLHRWVNEENVLPKIKIRNKVYFKRDDINELLKYSE